jgi:hypothetical protein
MNIDERLAALVERHEALTETVELLAEQQAEAEERHARETADFRRDLRRAFALGVQEARSQRRRSAALDEKITQLAAAQLVTEEKLQGLVEALRRGGNGSA